MPRRTVLAALLLGGCALRLPTPPSINRPVLTPAEEVARILTKVDENGLVGYDFGAHPNNLDAVAAYIATFSPESEPGRFPTAATRLAYYLNAYNMLVLYAVVDSDLRPVDQKRFYRRAKMMVGGRLRTLADLEEEIAELKDARAFFALCGGAKGHPKLARAPYEAGLLETQLDQAARDFLNDPKNVQVDKTRRVVRLSQVFQWRRAIFLDRAASLLAYINRFRTDKVPEHYKVEFLPFDWTLNARS
ncbi:MAG: DUF547 domain-containing protein [Elusimicrobia bacterium]|nr:DUF547 domain-containing protein [Elusimicrobiota bacterium]